MEAPIFDLSGRTALVTGAGRNVGAGIARALASRGARVVVNDLLAERAESVASEIGSATGGDPIASAFDVTDHEAVVGAVDSLPPIDILVNNAGVTDSMGITAFRDTRPEEWDALIRINTHGVMNCCHAVIDSMCERNWGRIVTISSAAGTTGIRLGVSSYAAGKGGGISFTRTLAAEVARNGVTANSLALGIITTGDDELDAELARGVPAGRIGTPDDVGPAVVWLASEEASWVTGQTIHIDGGSVTT